MNKIGTEHLSRTAYLYVRQSTPGQLTNNPESRRRQYGLKDRAYALGWQNVVVIDDDLGHTVQEVDLNLPAVQRAIKHGGAVSRDSRQGTLEFQ